MAGVETTEREDYDERKAGVGRTEWTAADRMPTAGAAQMMGEEMQVPNGTELIRPFIPARDFTRSKSFYETLGFEKLLDGDVAIFRGRLRRFHPAALLSKG